MSAYGTKRMWTNSRPTSASDPERTLCCRRSCRIEGQNEREKVHFPGIVCSAAIKYYQKYTVEKPLRKFIVGKCLRGSL